MTDDFDLERFVTAQNVGGDYDRAVAELTRGRKTSHWMWYVFPQIAGLGLSEMSRRYAISSVAEARAYLDHPVLGPRLEEVTRIVLGLENESATAVFGSIDAQKLSSSMTLFEAAAASGTLDEKAAIFGRVLDAYFGGNRDDATLRLLNDSAS